MGLLADIGRMLIKLDEPKSGTVSNEDIKKIISLLKFIAQGGLYGGLFALLGIGLASLYAGWLGMAAIMIVIPGILFAFESNKLNDILGTEKKTQWNQIIFRFILSMGFLLIAIAVMSWIDSGTTQIPRPTPIPYGFVFGIIGVGLTIVGLMCIRFRRS